MNEPSDPEQPGRWEPWLVALDAQIAAEDREDRRRQSEGRLRWTSESDADVVCFHGFAALATVARP